MASVNKWIGIGNLGRDPEVRYMPDGAAITNITMACNESWTDKASGEKKEHVEWVRIVFRGRLAEVAGEYLKKGSQCYVEGRLKTRKWQDKEGAERYTTEIVAERLQLLGSRNGGGEQAGHEERQPARQPAAAKREEPKAEPKRPAGRFDDLEDDIPFVTCELGADVIFRKLRWPLE